MQLRKPYLFNVLMYSIFRVKFKKREFRQSILLELSFLGWCREWTLFFMSRWIDEKDRFRIMAVDSEVDTSIHLKFNTFAYEFRFLHQARMFIWNGDMTFSVDDTVPGKALLAAH